jgi:hypothetical protein
MKVNNPQNVSKAVSKTLYHVVCHDCVKERVVDDRDLAERMVDAHVDARGHNIEYARVQGELRRGE